MQSGSRDYPPGIRFATSGLPVVATAKDSFCTVEGATLFRQTVLSAPRMNQMLQGAHGYRLAGYAVPEGAPDKPRGDTLIIVGWMRRGTNTIAARGRPRATRRRYPRYAHILPKACHFSLTYGPTICSYRSSPLLDVVTHRTAASFDCAGLADHIVIFGMRAHPEPDISIIRFNRHSPIVKTNACEPESANFLKVKRGMF